MQTQRIDIKENNLVKLDENLLKILLQDKTTGKNIIWATDNYANRGEMYGFHDEILLELITGKNGNVIKPRVEKSEEEQRIRIKQKAEVFTPSWVCNLQNNTGDNSWFGRENVFNIEMDAEHTWKTVEGKVVFPGAEGETWTDYVEANRMEITCGEAPYLTSRYDTVTGVFIPVKNRIGLLDRKLRVVTENTQTREDWLKWAIVAVQSTYGYEWQGDNILLARENILFDVAEYYNALFGGTLENAELEKFAEIIVWNIWQMDGLKFVIPNSCQQNKVVEETLFETKVISTECEGCKKKDYFKHNGIYCRIMDWKENVSLRFVDMLEKDK